MAWRGDLQNALVSWEASFHTQKTYHPRLLARFQSLMTFVNHQPACLHQQTLPKDTPFNTKAVAIPFKRGSVKAPLCSSEENKIPSLPNFKPLEIMQQRAFCCVSFGDLEPSLRKPSTKMAQERGAPSVLGQSNLEMKLVSPHTPLMSWCLLKLLTIKDANLIGRKH